MLIDTKLSDFVEAVAAKTPTPGGGSVSAAVGAMGAGLGIMTVRYSDTMDAEAPLDEVKKGFLELVDADAKAYGQVNAAMALPKSTEEEKKRRKEALQNALGDASEVPLRGMMLAARGLEALRRMAPKCNKHLVSDLTGAARFLEAACDGCGENVRINAAALADPVRRERLEKERKRLTEEAAKLRTDLLRAAERLYGGK